MTGNLAQIVGLVVYHVQDESERGAFWKAADGLQVKRVDDVHIAGMVLLDGEDVLVFLVDKVDLGISTDAEAT